ncbi:hypothetical protein OS493_036201, partial [Desmophyllum pertusum]
ESKPHLKRKASSCFTQDPKDQDKDEPSPQLGKLSSGSGTLDAGHATPVCAESAACGIHGRFDTYDTYH